MTLSEGEGGVPEDRTGGGRDTVTFFLPRTSALARFGREKRTSAVGDTRYARRIHSDALDLSQASRIHANFPMISALILPHAITLHFAIRLNTIVSHPNHICISWHHSADDTKDLKEKLKAKDHEI